MSNDTPNFPKRPIKNYVPFENPTNQCAVNYCPSFSTPECELCSFHCGRIHKGNHIKRSKAEIEELIRKYQSDNK